MEKHPLTIAPMPASLLCSFCGKSYISRNKLEKHTHLCEILFKTKNNKKITIEEEDEIPSPRRLYQLLLELGQKYNRLEEKVEEMNKWVAKKKKKINIIEWLNANRAPTISFAAFQEDIRVDGEEDIQDLFQLSFFEIFDKILTRALFPVEEAQRPIISFHQKANLFYIYEPTEQGWQPLSREKCAQFINRCHRKLSKALSEWKKNNAQQVNQDDRNAIQYDKTVAKLMGLDWRNDTTFSKAKIILHNLVKTDVKNVVEYEIEF